MTQEEKEAIETIQNYNNKKAVDLSLYFVDVSNASKIILNLIEKQQKELDKLRNKNKDLLRKLRNRVKQVKKLEKYALYKKEFSRLNKELEKKDKIIRLIAEAFRQDDIRSVDEIIEYFTKKADETNG